MELKSTQQILHKIEGMPLQIKSLKAFTSVPSSYSLFFSAISLL